MNLGHAGEELIKGFESYLDPLPDGRCKAYICPAGKATIGWGCTKGVKLGMIWTRQQADEGFRREIAECERDVLKLVSVNVNQNQFDALVSFQYNCGKLGSSTLLKKLNKGDYKGAQAEFMKWVWANEPRTGKKVQLRGLARRRAAEAELFARRTEEEAIEREPEVMAQDATTNEPMSPGKKAAAGTVGGVVVAKGAEAMIAAPPPAVTDTVANVDNWTKIGKAATSLSDGLWKSPIFAASLFAVAIAVIWGPTLWQKVKGS